jgi:hypothetical protein
LTRTLRHAYDAHVAVERGWLLTWVMMAACAILGAAVAVATIDGRAPQGLRGRTPPAMAEAPAMPAPATSLDILAATVSTGGWAQTRVEGHPFVVQAPRHYIHRSSVRETADGPAYHATITNFDPSRIAAGEPLLPSTPGMVSIALGLLPRGHPAERPGAPHPAEGAEQTTIMVLGHELPAWRGPGDASDRWPRADGTWIAGSIALTDGRTLVVSALVSTPEDHEGIRTAFGILSSLQLVD